MTDTATWERPASLATGIEHVLIGGRAALENGRLVDLRRGRVLRRRKT